MIIRETEKRDLENIRMLWKNGDVMMYVGFPDGLEMSREDMADWLADMEAGRPAMAHFSIYDGESYLGEAFYGLNGEMNAELDIKLLPEVSEEAADEALAGVVERAFKAGAEAVCASISPLNERAARLFERGGLIKKEMPETIRMPGFVYYELSKRAE